MGYDYDDPKRLYSDLYLIEPEIKIELAQRFSEGSEQLRQLLLLLWEKKIETVSCCSGIRGNHPDKKYNPLAHVYIRVTPEPQDLIFKFVSALQTNKFKVAVEKESLCIIIQHKRKSLPKDKSDKFFGEIKQMFESVI